MLSDLLISARELRNPLTVGYAALLSVWLVLGGAIDRLASDGGLGERLVGGLAQLGSTTEFALLTFIAAIVGSVLWNLIFERLVRRTMVAFNHPPWQELIVEARNNVVLYEGYTVKFPEIRRDSLKGQITMRGQSHRVPSPYGASYLQQAVEKAERREGEVIFRVTLALCLLPISVSMGVAGQGWWWLTLLAIPSVWADVAYLKHSTQRDIDEFEIEQLEETINRQRGLVAELQKIVSGEITESEEVENLNKTSAEDRLAIAINELRRAEERLMRLTAGRNRLTARAFSGAAAQPSHQPGRPRPWTRPSAW